MIMSGKEERSLDAARTLCMQLATDEAAMQDVD